MADQCVNRACLDEASQSLGRSRRRRLVDERGRVISAMQADLQAVAPGLLQITWFAGNLCFLNFLTCRKDIRKLARVRRAKRPRR